MPLSDVWVPTGVPASNTDTAGMGRRVSVSTTRPVICVGAWARSRPLSASEHRNDNTKANSVAMTGVRVAGRAG